MATWLFRGNPRDFDVNTYLQVHRDIRWYVHQQLLIPEMCTWATPSTSGDRMAVPLEREESWPMGSCQARLSCAPTATSLAGCARSQTSPSQPSSSGWTTFALRPAPVACSGWR